VWGGRGDNICIFIVMFSIELKALDHLIISCSPDYGLHLCQWMYLIMSWLIFDSTSVCWYCEILFNVVMQIIVSYMKECTKLFAIPVDTTPSQKLNWTRVKCIILNVWLLPAQFIWYFWSDQNIERVTLIFSCKYVSLFRSSGMTSAQHSCWR